MNRDKQIEEMAKVMNECCNRYDENGNHIGNKCYECEEWSDDNHCCCSYNTKEATALYTAGYRKASELAAEIFEEIEEYMLPALIGNKFPAKVINPDKFAELKKKYESEKDDG